MMSSERPQRDLAETSPKKKSPPPDARTWEVSAGHLWRIICTSDPQVADVNCRARGNPDERSYASKTRQIHATHLTMGDRLWSNMPYLRPLATIVEDTIAYRFDEDEARVHGVIGQSARAQICTCFLDWRGSTLFSTKPILCYAFETPPPPEKAGESLYASLHTTASNSHASLVKRLEIPPCDARTWEVPTGHLCWMIYTSGP
ncbi:hypothetical protein ACHAWF_015163 [Thalassiosira exigua]